MSKLPAGVNPPMLRISKAIMQFTRLDGNLWQLTAFKKDKLMRFPNYFSAIIFAYKEREETRMSSYKPRIMKHFDITYVKNGIPKRFVIHERLDMNSILHLDFEIIINNDLRDGYYYKNMNSYILINNERKPITFLRIETVIRKIDIEETEEMISLIRRRPGENRIPTVRMEEESSDSSETTSESSYE